MTPMGHPQRLMLSLCPLQSGEQSGASHQFYHDNNDGYLVLSVDDDPINQMVVENLLSTEGYQVRSLL